MSQAERRMGAVILAAGASRRMGAPKMLLPWGSSSVLGHIVNLWSNLSRQTVVVLAPENSALNIALNDLRFPTDQRVINPAPEEGMLTSIQQAAAWPGWKPDLTHCAIVLGDQPQIPRNLLERLCDFASANPGAVCQPLLNDRPKHPVMIPITALQSLADFRGASLREFLNSGIFRREFFRSDESALACDLDTPEDYAHARARFNV
jgi:molybdenum cofactor cytidylyltransferase